MKPIDMARLEALRIDTVLAGANLAALRPRFERMAARHENGTAPRAASAFQLFQTPPLLARRLIELAKVRPGDKVLEPSCGLGRLLDALPRCDITAVEFSPTIAGEVFRQNREGVTLLQRDFLACDPAELGMFDRVVMNPPFHLRADIRHILHARQFLKPGGVLAAICMSGPKREQVLKPLSSSWERVELGAFAKEGTNVSTIILTMRTP